MGKRVRETRKKRTRSQDVGERGEADFKALIKREGVLATKVGEDYGIDYLCQVVGPPDRHGTSVVTGDVIGAAVRATSNPRARIKLSPSDAGHLLAATFPVVVVMIDLRSDTPELYFRFIEGDFALKLADFVDGSAVTLSLTPSQLLPRTSFRAALRAVLRPGHAERLRLQLAERGLTKTIPDSRLGIARGPDGDLTIVELSSVVDQFEIDTPDKHKALLTAVFGAPSLLEERFAKLPRKQSMFDALAGLPGPILIAGPLVEGSSVLEVRDGTKSASCEFRYRRAEKWSGYVHETGFSIRISDAMPHEGAMVHFTEVSVDHHAGLDLSTVPSLWEFLEGCSEKATLYSDGEKYLPTSYFGDLMRLGFFARCLRTILGHSSPSEPWVIRGELTDEYLHAATCVAAILERKVKVSAIGAMVVEKDASECSVEQRTMRVPIVMNTPTGAVVVWLRVDADVFRDDGHLVGFRPTKLLSATVEPRKTRFAKTEWPEMVVGENYPTMALSSEGVGRGSEDAAMWGCEAELEKEQLQIPPSNADSAGNS